MSDMLKSIFAVVGLVTIVGITAGFGVILCTCVVDLIERTKNKYIIKHRFDKSPTAKCYCRDCWLWDAESGACRDHCNSRLMNPAWFCCFAEPIDNQKEFEKRNKNLK